MCARLRASLPARPPRARAGAGAGTEDDGRGDSRATDSLSPRSQVGAPRSAMYSEPAAEKEVVESALKLCPIDRTASERARLPTLAAAHGGMAVIQGFTRRACAGDSAENVRSS